MKVTEKKKDKLISELTIQVPAEAMEKQIEKRLREIGKKAKLDGFRQGKAPIEMLRKRFGDTARAEAVEFAVEEAVTAAFKEKEIKPAMQPKVDVTKFDNDNALEFTVTVEKLPKVEPADFKKIKLEKLTTPVSDKEIDDALARVAGNYKTTQPLATQRAAKMGDTVRIHFDGSTKGKKLPGMAGKDFDLELGANMFVGTFEEQLVGSKAGDKKTVSVMFPADYRHPDLKGQSADFEVEVVDVRESVAAEVNDELAQKAGMKTLADLKDAIKKQLENDYASVSRAKLKRSLLDALDKANKFDVPQGLVDGEFNQIWQYHLQDLKGRGMDMEKAEKDKDSKKEFTEIAERRVRLGLLLSEIGERQSVKVTNQEIHQAVLREAYNYPGQEQQVIKFYQTNAQALASLRAPIYEEKVVDYILGEVQTTEKKVSKEDLLHDPDAEAEEERVTKSKKK